MSFPAYETYKDSGDNCLGAVPIHWDAKRLRNIMSFSKGLTITKENLQDEGIPCVNYGEIHSKYGFRLNPTVHPLRCVAPEYLGSNPDALLRDGDFVFADTSEDLEGSGNFTHVRADIPLFAGYHTIIGRPRKYVFPLFLAFQLHSQFLRSQIQRQVKGIKVFSVSQAVLKSVKCWLPPLDEQKAISSFLGVETSKIDGLVSEQRRLIELLKEKRQAVISHAVTKGLNPNAPMKPSGIQWIGDVPRNWEVVPVKHGITRISQGFSPQCHSEPASEEEWGVVKVGCCNEFDLNESEQKRMPPEIEPVPEYEIQNGDILMSRGNTLDLVGSAALIQNVRPRLLLCDLVYRFRAQVNEFNPAFLVHSLRSLNVRSQIECNAVGSSATMKKVSQELVRNLLVCRPAIEEQNEIADYLRNKVKMFSQLQAEAKRAIELLQERRTALISAAVTGKIDVRQFAPVSGEALAAGSSSHPRSRRRS